MAQPPDENGRCTCFGDSGLHASTHQTDEGECCDLCGWPIQPEAIDVLTAVNSQPIELQLSDEQKLINSGFYDHEYLYDLK